MNGGPCKSEAKLTTIGQLKGNQKLKRHPRLRSTHSASSRISKGQGYQGFLRKGREKFWPKKGNLRRTRKNLKNEQNFTTFRVNKMFSHKF
jgi:hypothetical protein